MRWNVVGNYSWYTMETFYKTFFIHEISCTLTQSGVFVTFLWLKGWKWVFAIKWHKDGYSLYLKQIVISIIIIILKLVITCDHPWISQPFTAFIQNWDICSARKYIFCWLRQFLPNIFLRLSTKKLWASKCMKMKYAKIEKHALKNCFIYSFCICNYIITYWLQAKQRLTKLTSHWQEGNLSYVGSVYDINSKSTR